MSSFAFKKAVREGVSLLIGMAGESGSGKTYSAMQIAKGIAAGKPFAVIDTEAGRAKHYADLFTFDHGDLKPPFSPTNYLEAIKAADAAGYPVIVVDSMSHEHAGEGGLLDWHESELNRMAGDDWRKRDACNMAAWIKPKAAHKTMVQRLLQIRAHLILCFRAEEKVEMVRGDDGKMKITKKQTSTGLDGWMPICEKNLPYELTASFLFRSTAPGVPKPIKLQKQHMPFFPLDKPIAEDSGRLIAEWANGSAAPQGASPSSSSRSSAGAADSDCITEDQMAELDGLLAACDESAKAAFLKSAKLDRLEDLPAEDFHPCKEWIGRRKARAPKPAAAPI
jgi:hypothetical protein